MDRRRNVQIRSIDRPRKLAIHHAISGFSPKWYITVQQFRRSIEFSYRGLIEITLSEPNLMPYSYNLDQSYIWQSYLYNCVSQKVTMHHRVHARRLDLFSE